MKLALIFSLLALFSFSTMAQSVITLPAGGSATIRAGEQVVVSCQNGGSSSGNSQYDKYCNCDAYDSLNVTLNLYRLELATGSVTKLSKLQYFGGHDSLSNCERALITYPACR